MPIYYAAATDVGMKRKTNQDSIYANPEKNFFIVADGMGGHNGGDTASQMAIKYVPEYLFSNLSSDPLSASIGSVKYANTAIYNKSNEEPLLKGMGTTIVSLLFSANTLYVTNVGDSRAYLINKGNIYQLSKDHSLVQEKLNMGLYTREDAARDKMKNVLIRTVGYEENVEVDVFTYKVRSNDILFICSDGLYGRVSDHDIRAIIEQNLPDPSKVTNDKLKELAKLLIKEANQNGGNDNISVIIVVPI